MSQNALPQLPSSETRAQPCSLVIFGGGGDLSRRKLIPGIYNLMLDGLLPPQFCIVGVARTERSHESFREMAREGIESYSRQALDPDRWKEFEKRLFYVAGSFASPDTHAAIRAQLEKVEPELGVPPNRLFYLSIPPSGFAECVEQLKAAGLVAHPEDRHFSRVIVEKPIGNDLASAQEINATLARAFHESQTYRIDHYLGKETVQNIMVMRFANSLFEPMWNQKYIDHVHITVAEEEGVGTRAGYFEESGSLRDMVQNHILQVLTLTAMEPPSSLSPNVVRDHKLEVLECLRPIPPDRVDDYVVRAQYANGFHRGEEVPGYRREEGVQPDSTTETYVALKCYVDNWRWSGVPFYLRTGKALPRRASEIAVQFKAVPPVLFNLDGGLEPNVLALRIQPDEGLSMKMSAKVPGAKLRVLPVEMDFRYGSTFEDESPEAYERLLLDVMAGDASLFMRRDAVESSWRWIMNIVEGWEARGTRYLPEYAAGSWGPVEAERLIQSEGRSWRTL